MKDTELPSPDIGATGHELRRLSAKALSDIQIDAMRRSGSSAHAEAVSAFFAACEAAVYANGGLPALSLLGEDGQALQGYDNNLITGA